MMRERESWMVELALRLCSIPIGLGMGERDTEGIAVIYLEMDICVLKNTSFAEWL